MKSVSSFLTKILLILIFCALVFLPAGCSSEQMGETAAQGDRRHQRNFRINQQGMMEDLDKFLLLDKPSRLTEKRIP